MTAMSLGTTVRRPPTADADDDGNCNGMVITRPREWRPRPHYPRFIPRLVEVVMRAASPSRGFGTEAPLHWPMAVIRAKGPTGDGEAAVTEPVTPGASKRRSRSRHRPLRRQTRGDGAGGNVRRTGLRSLLRTYLMMWQSSRPLGPCLVGPADRQFKTMKGTGHATTFLMAHAREEVGASSTILLEGVTLQN